MTHLVIKRSGDANIVSLPKAVLKVLGLRIGSTLDLSIVNHKIVLTPVVEKKLTLEDLLIGTLKENLQLTNEDHDWLREPPVSKEI